MSERMTRAELDAALMLHGSMAASRDLVPRLVAEVMYWRRRYADERRAHWDNWQHSFGLGEEAAAILAEPEPKKDKP